MPLTARREDLSFKDTMKSETALEISHHRYGHMSSRNQLSERLMLTMEMVAATGLRDTRVWQCQVEALFDIKVIDTDAPHRNCSPEAILETGAKEKKRVYEQAVVKRKGNFTPIVLSVLSVDGLLHREAKHFLKRIAANLAHKWEKTYSQTLLGPDWPLLS